MKEPDVTLVQISSQSQDHSESSWHQTKTICTSRWHCLIISTIYDAKSSGTGNYCEEENALSSPYSYILYVENLSHSPGSKLHCHQSTKPSLLHKNLMKFTEPFIASSFSLGSLKSHSLFPFYDNAARLCFHTSYGSGLLKKRDKILMF